MKHEGYALKLEYTALVRSRFALEVSFHMSNSQSVCVKYMIEA